MPKKKSLSEELADLFNPAPTKEFDPEADVFGAGPALEESDDELAAAAAGATGRRRGKEAGRMRGEIVMEGREYAGRRSSRAAVFGEGEAEEEESSGEDGDDGDEEEGSKEEGSEEEGSEKEQEEEEEDAGWLAGGGSGSGSEEDGDDAPEEAAAGSGGASRHRQRNAAAAADEEGDSDGGGSGSGSEDEDDDDEEEGGGRGGSGAAAAAAAAAAADDEMAALEREYEAMQQEEQSAMAGLKERAAKERKKALAVQAQKAVWQRALEARILLQRTLSGANRLPQGDMQAVASAADSGLAAAFGGLAADAAGLLGQLLELLGALTQQNPAVGEAAAAAGVAVSPALPEPPAAAADGGSKRRRGDDSDSVGNSEAATAQRQEQDQEQQEGGEGRQAGAEELWGHVEASYAAIAPFRDASIDRWHRKTTLTTGGASLRGGTLKALNQSVSTQVSQLMQDPGKVLQRTRLLRTTQQQPQHRVLCADPEHRAAKRQRTEEDSEEEAQEANGVDAVDDEHDPETFDDTEFYQTLLREFLEGSADAANGGNWHTGPKQRKAVDRRASKGRKLRYHVHEKLVNFMTPVDLAAPQFVAQLFTNLFGGGNGSGGKQK